MTPLLRADGLSVTYWLQSAAAVSAIRDVHFSIERGEVVGLAGPSGSGKSTLALALLRALPRNAQVIGKTEFTGNSMSAVFQEPLLALHPMLSIGRQIYEAVKARRRWDRRRTRAEAATALERVGLGTDRFHRAYAHELSGGQRHRALIAQAIAGEPDLIIADEPTASLDREGAAEIIALLNDLRKSLGSAFLFITHSESLLRGFADRIVAMREGRLVA